MSDSHTAHVGLSESCVSDSLRTHPRKGKEGKGREGSGEQVIHEPHPPRATTDPVDNPTPGDTRVMDAGGPDQPLFAGFKPPPSIQLSAGQRLTRRQAEQIALGIHPLTLAYTLIRPLHPHADRTRTANSPQDDNTPTCGNCIHRATGGYPKCTEPSAPRSHGHATDVRAWWPACTHWTPKAGA